MALQTYLDAFNVSTGGVGTTYVRTGYGFQPKALIVWATCDTGNTDQVVGGHGGYSIGFATSTSERGYAAISSEDNQNSSDTDRMMNNNAVVGLITISGTVDGLLDISAIGSDGVTFIVDDAFSAGYRVFVLALGGTDLTNAKAGAFTMSTAAATQDVTDPGFQPDAVLMVCSSLTALGLGQSSILSFGAASGATPVNGVVAGLSAHASPTMVTRGYCRAGTGTSGDAVVALTTTPGFDARARVSAWLSTGFTLSYDDQAGSAHYVVYLALKGGSYAIGDLLTQTDTTTDITESPGFQPQAGLMVSACRAADSAGTLTNHHEMSVGAFTSATSEGAQGHWDENGTSYSECARAQENDACYVNISSSDTLDGAMHITTINSTGFVARMADADPAQSFVWYLVLGSNLAVTKSHSTDSLKYAVATKQHSTDAYLAAASTTYTKSHTADALKYATTTEAHGTDALKYAAMTQQHDTDALKYAVTIKQHTADALKYAVATKQHSTDAYLNAATSTYTRTHGTDALVQGVYTKQHSTDALKYAVAGRQHTSDALKYAVTTKTHTTDSMLSGPGTKTHSTDALKYAITTKQHAADAYKALVGIRAHTTDSLLWGVISRQHATDAWLAGAGAFEAMTIEVGAMRQPTAIFGTMKLPAATFAPMRQPEIEFGEMT